MDRKALDRLLRHVVQNDHVEPGLQLPCWSWTGNRDPKGRPRFYWKRKGGLARRALMEILLGQELPDCCVVMPLCGNSDCLRPEHLVFCNEHDANALGQHGHIGPGNLALMRDLQDRGYDANEIAVFNEISVPLVEAVLAESAAQAYCMRE